MQEYMLNSDLVCDEHSVVLLSLNDGLGTKEINSGFIQENMKGGDGNGGFVALKDYSPVGHVGYERCPVVKTVGFLKRSL
jgi:hypothetical protein